MSRAPGGLSAILAVAALALAAPVAAQGPPRAVDAPDRARDQALRVFVDCARPSCDQEFLQTEIDFVSHVRDRGDAQVLVLLTTQPTGAGGTEYTMSFIGQKQFRGADDTLRYVAGPAESEDHVRRGLADTIKRGLVRYANHTPLGERLRVSYAAPPSAEGARAEPRDSWNHWTFGTTIDGSLNGEKSFRFLGAHGSLWANHTTQAWKIAVSLQAGYSENRVEASGIAPITTVWRDYGLNTLVVKSLGGHWSAGAQGTLTSSTFLNQSRALRLAPAVEYDLFPYSQSTRRQLTIQYSVGATSFDYAQETIFGRTAETLLDERVVASFGVVQPWGSAAASLEGSHYLRDVSKRRGVATGNVGLHLIGGLSLRLLGGLELVQDQLYLSKQGATDEEILLRQRQLATSFRYWSSIGFGYTFGSPFADVVNPRFGGSSGGTGVMP
ncbi:MAG: hypothetical protein ACJ79S_01545 [Gemmatimonadaceae bacterium]